MSNRPRCYTWAEVKDHKIMARRFVTEKDFAWVLLASLPECTVVDVEIIDPGHAVFRLNRSASNATLDKARKILEERRPVNVVMEVGYLNARR